MCARVNLRRLERIVPHEVSRKRLAGRLLVWVFVFLVAGFDFVSDSVFIYLYSNAEIYCNFVGLVFVLIFIYFVCSIPYGFHTVNNNTLIIGLVFHQS